MSKLIYLQINEHIALQQAVVKHQVNKEKLFFKRKPFLLLLKNEALTKFKQ